MHVVKQYTSFQLFENAVYFLFILEKQYYKALTTGSFSLFHRFLSQRVTNCFNDMLWCQTSSKQSMIMHQHQEWLSVTKTTCIRLNSEILINGSGVVP